MTPDYSMLDLDARAAAALVALRESHVAPLLDDAKRRLYWFRRAGMPVVSIVGYSRAGKDTAADFICERFKLKRPPSSSLTCLPLVAHMAGTFGKHSEFYAERHKHREFWLHACHALRREDPCLLAKLCLGAGDLIVGVRGKVEFDAMVQTGLVDLSVWVDNSRVDRDHTVEFSREDCDVVVDNHTTLDQFHRRLERLFTAVLPRTKHREGN